MSPCPYIRTQVWADVHHELAGVHRPAEVAYARIGDERAQWAHFQQKKLFPFNIRLQLSGSDEKGGRADILEPGSDKPDSDHDIQEMVSQAVTESQEEDVPEDSNAKAAADKSMRSQAAAISTDSTGKEKVLAKLKHELDKRLDSSSTGEQKNTADSDSDNNDKEDPDIEYKLRTKGVQVHNTLSETPYILYGNKGLILASSDGYQSQLLGTTSLHMQVGESSDFWNNYKTDIKLAQEIGKDLSAPSVCLYQYTLSAMLAARESDTAAVV